MPRVGEVQKTLIEASLSLASSSSRLSSSSISGAKALHTKTERILRINCPAFDLALGLATEILADRVGMNSD